MERMKFLQPLFPKIAKKNRLSIETASLINKVDWLVSTLSKLELS